MERPGLSLGPTALCSSRLGPEASSGADSGLAFPTPAEGKCKAGSSGQSQGGGGAPGLGLDREKAWNVLARGKEVSEGRKEGAVQAAGQRAEAAGGQAVSALGLLVPASAGYCCPFARLPEPCAPARAGLLGRAGLREAALLRGRV